MHFKILLVVLIFSFFIIPNKGNSQEKDLFTFSSTHKIEERNSYSIFYPINVEDYDGVVVLIHSMQASNPKVYGNFINFLLRKNYIVIYPAYQDYVVSKNAEDLNFISSSLTSAYKDIKKNYENVLNLPVTFIGHSMGGIIAYELASGQVEVPKMPSCVISLCPAEVKKHDINNINFNKLDSYDVYLIIEEENDKYYRNETGTRLFENNSASKRKRHIVHAKDEDEKSKHMNFWSPNKQYNSKNNTFFTYFPSLIGTTNEVDSEFYWKEISNALDCAISRKNCEGFKKSSK